MRQRLGFLQHVRRFHLYHRQLLHNGHPGGQEDHIYGGEISTNPLLNYQRTAIILGIRHSSIVLFCVCLGLRMYGQVWPGRRTVRLFQHQRAVLVRARGQAGAAL